MTPDPFLTTVEAAELVGLSRAAFLRGVTAGRFPAPFYPASKSPRWRRSELIAAVEATRALPREAMEQRRAAKLAGRAA